MLPLLMSLCKSGTIFRFASELKPLLSRVWKNFYNYRAVCGLVRLYNAPGSLRFIKRVKRVPLRVHSGGHLSKVSALRAPLAYGHCASKESLVSYEREPFFVP